MLCPACNSHGFANTALESGLAVESCTKCGGVWMELDAYRRWRERTPDAETSAAQMVDLEPAEGAARLCPKTGLMMARIKVMNEVPLRLDYSAMAQGVWLDGGEWEALQALGLHRQLDGIVSERWQRQLQEAASRERMEKAHRARFGDEAYDKLVSMRQWLSQQNHRAEMIAFLNAREH
ncbi:MAG: zf-TFIIB domain-containing protein [Burkholderiales bacterium]|nr:zf-TFIIB domain-containing protein [Burkholderiales bacterium]